MEKGRKKHIEAILKRIKEDRKKSNFFFTNSGFGLKRVSGVTSRASLRRMQALTQVTENSKTA